MLHRVQTKQIQSCDTNDPAQTTLASHSLLYTIQRQPSYYL